jgi:uncharacterized short protein YbdD (DUF466 family)
MSSSQARRKRKRPHSEEETAKQFFRERKDQSGFEIKTLQKKGLSV